MPRIPGNNMTTKILALILATILWMYVMNEQNPSIESTYTVPVEVRNLAEDMLLIDTPENVRVKLRGPRGLIAGVRSKDIQAYADTKGLQEGRHNVRIYATTPASLELVELYPGNISLRIDRQAQRPFVVELRYSGTIPPGGVVGKATLAAVNAAVSGPKSRVDLVDKVVVLVDLTGKKVDFTANATLLALNKEGKEVDGVTLSPAKTNVNVQIVSGIMKKTVDVKTIADGQLPNGYTLKSITTDPEKIELGGDPEVVQKMEFVYTEPIHLTGLIKSTEQEVRLQLQEGLAAEKNTVLVRIDIEAGNP